VTGAPVLVYTDGPIEARDTIGTFFPLTECVSIHGRPDPETLLDLLSAEVSSYTSHQRHDDMALLLMWRHIGATPSGSATDQGEEPATDQAEERRRRLTRSAREFAVTGAGDCRRPGTTGRPRWASFAGGSCS